MELIDIISNIIIYGSGLLVLVVLFSFVLYKTRTDEIEKNSNQVLKTIPKPVNPVRLIDIEQAIARKDQAIYSPQIFRIDNLKPIEIKVIRRASETKRESQEAMRFDPRHLTRTDGNGIRYTIVNEELKKKNLRAANFYL